MRRCGSNGWCSHDDSERSRVRYKRRSNMRGSGRSMDGTRGDRQCQPWKDMISEIHSSETPSAADAIMSSRDEVNMFNCYKHRQHFFNRCKDGMIHHDVLISFWMMARYLGPIDSIDEAYKKGNLLLRDLIQGGLLKPSDEDPDMIELVVSRCRHEFSPCDATSVGFVEMLPVDRIENVLLTDGKMKQRKRSDDGNYLCRQVFQSQRGLKYIAHFNPTPNSLKPLLENIEHPSVLMLRGCDDHLFPMRDFTFGKFKTLTVLQISCSGLLTTAPLHPTVSKLTQLRYLYLSDPLIKSLPEDLFSELLELRCLILRGCSRLDFNLDIGHLENLEVLDLSNTSTTWTPFIRDSALKLSLTASTTEYKIKVLDLSGNQNLEELLGMNTLTNLEVLDVSDCKNLRKLPEDVGNLKNMKELNLAGCIRLENLGEGFFDQMSCLLKLDLSATKVKHLPSFANLTSLRKLTLRGLELDSLKVETWTSLSNLVKLDLHGLKISTSEELKLDFLRSLLNLQTLNLSKTSVAKLPDISNLVSLKELLLADCWNLKALPDLQALTSLETLDVPLSIDPTVKGCQLEVEHAAQRVLPLNLSKLVLTSRPDVQRLFPLCGTDEIDIIGVPWSKKSENLQGQRTISKAVEFHIVYDVGHTAFDRFIYKFEGINALILDIQRSCTNKIANPNNIQANYFERQFKMLHLDMKYIQENIDRLKGSRDCKSSEELLEELVDAATHLSPADFKDDPQNLKQLLRLVVRLKLLFPPTQINHWKASKTTQKNKQLLLIKSAPIVLEKELSIVERHPQEITNLRLKYESLTRVEKNCLLCFSAFPYNDEKREKKTGVLKKSLVVKKRILLYWWVGEGFLEKSFEDNGKQILEVLMDNGFIEPVIKKWRKSGSFRMHHHVHSFVTAEAKSEGFFDFNREKNSCLDPYVTRSKKDCLLKTEDNFSISTELWANRKNSQGELESVRNVLTLFNVKGSVIDIKPEWFSKMMQLSVLSLGSWGCPENVKHIEIVDQKFLEELKRMKQLRLISLQGLTTIMKLPDSICKLTDLIMLDLRECGCLEELPAGIGSLRNLVFLDLTDCFFLNKMPKGISLLLNLELLKGFKITHEETAAGDQNAPNHKTTQSQWEKTMESCLSVIHGKDNKASTLRDLLKLEKLSHLNLVVNIKEFPSYGDLEVLIGMKRLRKLRILWEKSFYSDNASVNSTSHDETDRLGQQHFDSIDHVWDLAKLELWCFPYKALPNWVIPRKFKNLQTLYIVGGDLLDFPMGFIWPDLKILRLKYLREMRVSLYGLQTLFPKLTYMEIKECLFCSNSIWWNDGKCIWDLPPDSYPGRFSRFIIA